MDFSIKCAYAHGTSALRTHLINMTPRQTELTWPVFAALRKRWAGKVRAPTAAVFSQYAGKAGRLILCLKILYLMEGLAVLRTADTAAR